MVSKTAAVLEKIEKRKATIGTCRHHWIIESAVGPTSEGICKYCGEKRTFLNIVEDTESKEDVNRFFDKVNSPDGSEPDDEEE